jgi:hypothetical protein
MVKLIKGKWYNTNDKYPWLIKFYGFKKDGDILYSEIHKLYNKDRIKKRGFLNKIYSELLIEASKQEIIKYKL